MFNAKPAYPDISFRSPEWGKVKEWLEGELLETYQRLSSLEIDDKETQRLRGRASFIKMMLDFGHTPAATSR